MKAPKERLDRLMVERGLAPSREKARAYILAGSVAVEGERVRRSAAQVPPDADIRILEQRGGYVSRGGQKLEGALDAFGLDPAGCRCLDIGASTGGFTHCLLIRGALQVTAVDVGRNQLHYALRTDPRVRVVERFNARYLGSLHLDAPPDLVTVDVSFISLLRILAPLRGVVHGKTRVVALVKPQFELDGPPRGFRGVVTDPREHERVLISVRREAEELGYSLRGVAPSSLAGPKGNLEFFLHLVPAEPPPAGHPPSDVEPASVDDRWEEEIRLAVRRAHRQFSEEKGR